MPHSINNNAASMTNITLYIPGMFGPFPAEWKKELQLQLDTVNLKALTRLLSRARPTKETGDDFYQKSFQLFNHTGMNTAPIASCRYIATVSGADKNKWCINCDPVIIQPDRDQAVLSRVDSNLLDADACKQVVDKINEYYKDEPWELLLTAKDRWVIVSDNQYDLNTTSLAQTRSKNINEHLPAGADARYWHQVLNEVQMLLYQIENFTPDNRPQLMFNSVWLWGQGVFPDTRSAAWKNIFTDDDDITSVAKAAGIECDSINAFGATSTTGPALLISKQLQDTLLNQDLEKWLVTLARLNEAVFIPLSDKLYKTTMNEFTLLSDGQSFTASHADNKRWWKRTKKFTDFIQWQ